MQRKLRTLAKYTRPLPQAVQAVNKRTSLVALTGNCVDPQGCSFCNTSKPLVMHLPWGYLCASLMLHEVVLSAVITVLRRSCPIWDKEMFAHNLSRKTPQQYSITDNKL